MSASTKAGAASGPTKQGVRLLMRRLARTARQHPLLERQHAHDAARPPVPSSACPRACGRVSGELSADTLASLCLCRTRAAALLIQPTATPEAATTPPDGQHTGSRTHDKATSSPSEGEGATSASYASLVQNGCFSKVISEDAINRVEGGSDSTLCGLAIAVSDALHTREFTPSGSASSVLEQLRGRRELPLVSWLRRRGAMIVAEVSSETPASVREGTCFGPQARSANAVVSGACHYALGTSLLGPPALTSCVTEDVIGFKPTTQTFGTFTEDFKMPVSAMAVGLTAGTVDDLLYLWQRYTASIDEDVAETVNGAPDAPHANQTGGNAHRTGPAEPAEQAMTRGDSQLDATADGPTTAGPDSDDAPAINDEPAREEPVYADPAILDHSPSNYTIQPSESQSSGPTTAAAGDASSEAREKEHGTGRHISFHLSAHERHKDREGEESRTRATHSALHPLGHTRWSPCRPLEGLADIDVGWRDYNETAMREAYRRTPASPGWWRHLLGGRRRRAQSESAADALDGSSQSRLARTVASLKSFRGGGSGAGDGSPLVELTVGYPTEWLDGPCRARYGGAAGFHHQLTRMVYTRSALQRDRKLEIVPLAIDLDLTEVLEAVQIIARYDTARAFERVLPAQLARVSNEISGGGHGSPSAPGAAPDKTSAVPSGVGTDLTSTPPPSPNLALMTSLVQELPAELLRLLDEGQRVSLYAYHRALRTRDEVVRVTEDHFQDVDMLVVPLLSQPYASGDLRSVLPVLPFHLAGHPILSMQLSETMPVALVAPPGHDAALLEDAYRFVQFTRGSVPRWWQPNDAGAPQSA